MKYQRVMKKIWKEEVQRMTRTHWTYTDICIKLNENGGLDVFYDTECPYWDKVSLNNVLNVLPKTRRHSLNNTKTQNSKALAVYIWIDLIYIYHHAFSFHYSCSGHRAFPHFLPHPASPTLLRSFFLPKPCFRVQPCVQSGLVDALGTDHQNFWMLELLKSAILIGIEI